MRTALVLAAAVAGALVALRGGAVVASLGTITGLIAPTSGAVSLSVPGVAPGGCVAYAPTRGDAGKTVFLDPGHGGPDPGVIGLTGGRPVQEKDLTLAVANRLAALLRGDGSRVVMSRTKDSLVTSTDATGDPMTLTPSIVHADLVARLACANASRAAVLISIHFNGLSDPSVAGTETFYDDARSFSADNRRLASDLQSAMVASLGADDRGVWPDDQNTGPALTPAGDAYGHLMVLGPPSPGYVDSPSDMPGALVEPLFVSNPSDAQLAISATTQQRLAEALDAAIRRYLAGG